MVLGTIRKSNERNTNAYYWQGSFDITIDGRQYNQRDIPARTIFVPGSGNKPNFDSKTRQFDFGSNTNTTPTIQMGTKVIPIPNGTIAYPTTYRAMHANTLRVVYNVYNSTAQVVAWNEVLPPNTVIVCLIVYNYPGHPFISGGFPYTIDGVEPNLLPTDNPIDAKIKGIIHRGFNTVAPEESKSAYLLSKRNGYHHWEGDINWTKDNVPMMIHDLPINRTARNLDGTELSSTVNLTDLNYADLAKYDFGIVKGDRYKGELLLSFEELVKLARYNDAFLHIEFKYAFTQEQVQMLHNIVVKYNMLDRIGWQAFGWDNLKPMMALEPNGQYELLGGDVTDNYFTKMAELKTDTNTIIASQNAALSVDDIQKIADKGYPIYLWTVDDGDTVRKFRDIGMVEGIMTNGAINVADELAK